MTAFKPQLRWLGASFWHPLSLFSSTGADNYKIERVHTAVDDATLETCQGNLVWRAT